MEKKKIKFVEYQVEDSTPGDMSEPLGIGVGCGNGCIGFGCDKY